MGEQQTENILAIFLTQAARNLPIRLPREKAEVYVNRSGAAFDVWALARGIDPASTEFYVFDLAAASLKDYPS